MYTRERTGWTKHIDFMILDILVLNIACAAAYLIRFPNSNISDYGEFFRNYIILYSAFTFLAAIMLNNLSNVLKRGLFQELIAVMVLAFTALSMETLYLFASHGGNAVSRIAISLGAVFFALLDFSARLLWKSM